jgi:hypothetical protein
VHAGSNYPLLQGVVREGGAAFLHEKPEDDRHLSTNRRRFGAGSQALHDILVPIISQSLCIKENIGDWV